MPSSSVHPSVRPSVLPSPRNERRHHQQRVLRWVRFSELLTLLIGVRPLTRPYILWIGQFQRNESCHSCQNKVRSHSRSLGWTLPWRRRPTSQVPHRVVHRSIPISAAAAQSGSLALSVGRRKSVVVKAVCVMHSHNLFSGRCNVGHIMHDV